MIELPSERLIQNQLQRRSQGEENDLAWAGALVEEGLAELNHGEALPAEEVFASIEARSRETL